MNVVLPTKRHLLAVAIEAALRAAPGAVVVVAPEPPRPPAPVQRQLSMRDIERAFLQGRAKEIPVTLADGRAAVITRENFCRRLGLPHQGSRERERRAKRAGRA